MADPVPPFGATVAGVRALLPQVNIVAATPEHVAVSVVNTAITEAQVRAWLIEDTAHVARALDGYLRLSDEQQDGAPGDRANLAASARSVVLDRTASRTEAALHPARTSTDEASYAGVLWTRAREALAELTAWLEGRLRGTDPAADPGQTPTGAGGGSYVSAPPPAFTRGMGF